MPKATLDPFAILAALGRSDPAGVEPVSGGADAAIWRVDQAGESFALRVLRPEQAGQATRETTAMTAAAAGGIPVPAVVTTGMWEERPALLLGWSPGRPLVDALRQRPWDVGRTWALGLAFGRVQAAIHALQPPAGLPNLWETWHAVAGPDPALQTCLAAVAPRPPALLHLDYHPLNVLAEGREVTAVLDWANAGAGDPRADLARTLSILSLSPLPTGPAGLLARAGLRGFTTAWRRGYRQVAGPVGTMAPFCWWAGKMMERDLAPRLGRPDLPWLTPAYFERLRSWTAAWRTRAEHRT